VGKKSEALIVGLTGKNASGKGETARLLQKFGYQYHSLSDILRKEAAKRGLSDTRESLVELGQTLREQEGAGVLAKRMLQLLEGRNYVIDSIRSPSEVIVLKKLDHFLLIGIDAPIQLRFGRAMKRGRNESADSLDDFKRMEERENSSNPLAQQLDECLRLADCIIQNNGTLEQLEIKLIYFLSDHKFPIKGP